MKCSATLYSAASAVAAAAFPTKQSNTPYKKEDGMAKTARIKNFKSMLIEPSHLSARFNPCRLGTVSSSIQALAPRAACDNGSTFIDPSSSTISTSFNRNNEINSFRQRVCSATDVSMRPLLLLLDDAGALNGLAADVRPTSPAAATRASGRSKYGELLEQFSCRWAAKFYGKVTFGPRNFPYPSSRWLARRFQMKKHRILKRFRFRRYKLAAVANLPFAKMIRVGMLPELKSSKTKKGDTVDMGLSSQLVTAARTSAGATKSKGKRTRPKSKYQV